MLTFVIPILIQLIANTNNAVLMFIIPILIQLIANTNNIVLTFIIPSYILKIITHPKASPIIPFCSIVSMIISQCKSDLPSIINYDFIFYIMLSLWCFYAIAIRLYNYYY